MSQHINTMHLNDDKCYLKAHDSISLDAMINFMLDVIPYCVYVIFQYVCHCSCVMGSWPKSQ